MWGLSPLHSTARAGGEWLSVEVVAACGGGSAVRAEDRG